MSRSPQRVVVITGAVTALLLAVLAYALIMSGRNARADLERGLVDRATIVAALTESLLAQTAESYDPELIRAYSARVVDAKVMRDKSWGALRTAAIDDEGRVLAAWPPRSSDGAAARGALRRAARSIPRGQTWGLSVVAGGLSFASAYDTPFGRRTVVSVYGADMMQGYFGDYLERTRTHPGDEAYIIDARGVVIGSAQAGTAPRTIAVPSAARGWIQDRGPARFYASVGVAGTDWRVVVRVPKARLYAPVGGLSSWLSWGLLAGFTAMALLVILLVQRLAVGSSRLARANSELEIRNEQVVMADRTKSDFLASMSHELRTPLNGIIGFAELMHDGRVGPVSDQHREYLGDILSSSNHLRRLIDDVLDLSKIEAGKIDLRPERVECAKVVGEVCDVVQSLAVRKRIELTCEIDPDIGPLDLDPGKLKQVLFNYVSNALKFTPEGGHVSVRATAEPDERFRIVVEDDGPGISDEDLERLWSAFEQLETGASRRYGGTGLGLSLTRRIVEAQGGEVGVDSTVGHGTRFHVVLPCNASRTSASDHALVLQ